MATLLDSPLTFFSKATPEQFTYVLGQYREIFKVHAQETRGAKKNGPAELIKLDNWYQDTLPQLIRSRKDNQLFYDDLVQLTKWKLLRGKFRPSLLDLVKTNTETAVKNVTKKAFKKMPNINAAMQALTQLKGIAPATASAILVAHSPNICPYMADENMASTPGVEESDLSISEYLTYVEQTNICVERLRAQDSKTDWTPHKVELAIWTFYQCKQYNSNLLDNMPLANGKLVELDEVEEQKSNGKLDDQEESSNESKQISNEDLNSNSEADENSNQSVEQQNQEEMNVELTNGTDSQLCKSNGHFSNGNGIHGGDESNSNVSVPSILSSENEDKSNDSLLNNKQEKFYNLPQLNKETMTNNVDNKTGSVDEPQKQTQQLNLESSVQNQSNNDNQMEVVRNEQPLRERQETHQESSAIVNKKVEELNNHLNNHLEELNNDNALTNNTFNTDNKSATDKLIEQEKIQSVHNNHCNGTLENGIKNIFNKATVDSIKDNLISSSEENSNNNLSEENSNLSGSNLSYSDLHSASDNAIDDGPALKRIRVE